MRIIPLLHPDAVENSRKLNSPDLPLVSVIVPCYNLERFVTEALESIAGQDYPNLEIIIVDDCSTDRTPSMIGKWIKAHSARQIIFVQNEKNKGLCGTLNVGISRAAGKYIARLDPDDVWEPCKIRGQVQVMESLPETTAVLYSDAFRMDEAGRPLKGMFIQTYRSFDKAPEGDINEIMWNGNFIPVATTLIRRFVFDRVGLYDEELSYDDWDMWLRISKEFHFAYYAVPTAKYRVVGSSMSNAGLDKMNLSNEVMFTKHLLKRNVSKSVRNKAFNYAVRRIFRERKASFKTSLQRLNKILSMYPNPRLVYAWVLFLCGVDYKYYTLPLGIARNVASFLK